MLELADRQAVPAVTAFNSETLEVLKSAEMVEYGCPVLGLAVLYSQRIDISIDGFEVVD